MFPCVLSQRVYDEEVEETITKTDGLEKQPEQVDLMFSAINCNIQ